MNLEDHRVYQARVDGFYVFYADASRTDMLQVAGVECAAVLVITLDKTKPARWLVNTMRHLP